MNNYLLILIIAVLSLVMGGLIVHYTIDKPVVIKDTITIWTDTGKIKPAQLKIVKVQKPVSISQLDSIYNAAKLWAIANTPHDTVNRPVFGRFVVTHDSSFINSDSTVRLIAHNEVSSMLPFYKPEFNDRYEIKSTPKTIITNDYNPTFFQRFQPALFIGFGGDLIRKQMGVYAGVGFSFSL
jgi:hypothetical protein